MQAAKKVRPSVVYIASFTSVSGEKKQTSFGSGTIFSESGHLITNYHVIKDADYYEAVLSDGTRCSFKRFRNNLYHISDQETDIALLQLNCADMNSLTAVERGSSIELNDGDWVIAVGNPYGLSNSVTKGIVSSTNRSDVGFSSIEDFIQTDVPINPGNSGGPLVNTRGEMIGLNTAIRTVSGGFQGISFSIPVEIVESVYTDLISYGRVRRGWIGVMVAEKEAKNSNQKSVVVVSTLENSPAQLVGISRGDIVIMIDNIQVRSTSEMTKLVKNRPVGSRIQIVVKRNGVLKRFSIVMNEKEYFMKVGMALNRLYARYGIKLDLNAATDTVVISDLSLQRVARKNLFQGDVVTMLNGRNIENLSDFASVFRRSSYRVSVLKVKRSNEIITIRIDD